MQYTKYTYIHKLICGNISNIPFILFPTLLEGKGYHTNSRLCGVAFCGPQSLSLLIS